MGVGRLELWRERRPARSHFEVLGCCQARSNRPTTSWSLAKPIERACPSASRTGAGTPSPFRVYRTDGPAAPAHVAVSHSGGSKDPSEILPTERLSQDPDWWRR